MLRSLIVLSFFCLPLQVVLSQSGTSGDPFTSFEQSTAVTIPGTYYFDLSGTTFSTHIDGSGYTLVAIDFGNGTGDLPQGSSLTATSRGILTPAILAELTAANEVRISSSSGSRDVTTNDATILSRVLNNTTLHRGSVDNGINDSWSGVGEAFFTRDATGSGSLTSSLHERVFHPSGNTNTFHWQPSINQQRERHGSGEIGSTESLQIWLKYDPTFPVEILYFNAELNPATQQVNLTWQTATEVNNKHFVLEHSHNSTTWTTQQTIEGVGNSTDISTYSTVDDSPAIGLNYYRLRQVDMDGTTTYSQIQSISLAEVPQSRLFPSPATTTMTLSNCYAPTSDMVIIDLTGKNITHAVEMTRLDETTLELNISHLPQGQYWIRIPGQSLPFVKVEEGN